MGHWQRVHFIEELSHHGITVHVFNPLLCKSWDEANEKAMIEFKKGKYDLFFSAVCDKSVLYKETLDVIKANGVPTLCLRFDNLVIPLYDKEMAAAFDLLWLTSIETKRFYDKWGANSCFAPYAANPYTFKYTEVPSVNRVCFVGTPYGSRARMFNTLLKGGVDLTLYYGHSCDDKIKDRDHYETYIEVPPKSRVAELLYRFRFKEGRIMLRGSIKNKLMGNCIVDQQSKKLLINPAVSPYELSEVYSKYALSLASTSVHHTDVLKNPLKIINLRNFEIPMSGGVEICRYNPELADYYEENKEIVFYRSNEEFVDKALYYTQKASDQEIRKIRMAARARSEKEHTWTNRFSVVLNELGMKVY